MRFVSFYHPDSGSTDPDVFVNPEHVATVALVGSRVRIYDVGGGYVEVEGDLYGIVSAITGEDDPS